MDLLDFGLKALSDYLSEAVKRGIAQRAQRRLFADGQEMHARGDDGARLCIIVTGAARFGRFQHDGSFKLLTMLGPGAHYGDVALQRREFTQSVFAVGHSEVDVLEASALDELLNEQSGLAIALWRCNTARLNAVLELYDDARTLPVAARLAKVVYVHMGRGDIPDGVACLQRDLAALLGVSQVSIGNALRELERAGLVKAGYGKVMVPDKAKLKLWLRKSGAA